MIYQLVTSGPRWNHFDNNNNGNFVNNMLHCSTILCHFPIREYCEWNFKCIKFGYMNELDHKFLPKIHKYWLLLTDNVDSVISMGLVNPPKDHWFTHYTSLKKYEWKSISKSLFRESVQAFILKTINHSFLFFCRFILL